MPLPHAKSVRLPAEIAAAIKQVPGETLSSFLVAAARERLERLNKSKSPAAWKTAGDLSYSPFK